MSTAFITVTVALIIGKLYKDKDKEKLAELSGKLVMYFMMFCLFAFLALMIYSTIKFPAGSGKEDNGSVSTQQGTD
jgi:zona occludens toxin (predicted ATPase)